MHATLLVRTCLVALLAVLLTGSSSLALFADQAGLNDWTKQFVGEVTLAAPLGDRTIVATAQGVIAALLNGDGELLWRRVLPKDDSEVLELVIHKDIIVTRTTRTVRVWSADGQLLWDQGANDVRDVDLADEENLLILTSEKLLAFTLATGASVNKLARDVPANSVKSALLVANGMTRVVSSEAKGAEAVIKISEGAGVPAEYASTRTSFAVLPEGAVAYFSASSDRKVTVKDFVSGQTTEVEVPHGGVLSTVNGVAVLVDEVAHKKSILVSDAAGAFTFSALPARAEASKISETVWTFPGDHTIVRTFKSTRSVLNVPQCASVKRAWSLSSSEIMTLCSDGLLAMLEVKGETPRSVWSREEALAEVIQVVSTSIPHVFGGSSAGPIGRLMESVNSFSNATVAMLQGITEAAMRAAKGGEFELKTVQESSEEERARFGFNRVLVFLTKKHKLFGIHSETGVQMWTRSLEGFERPTMTVLKDIDPNPQVLVLDVTSGRAETLSTITGAMSVSSKTITKGKKVIQAMVADAENSKTVVTLCDDLSVVEFPQPATRSAPTFMHVFNKETGMFSGYRIEPHANRAVVSWSIAFSSKATLAAFASPGQIHDPVSSQVRSLGDGSLMVKHTNPHLVAVIIQDEGLKVHLIDTVSGRMVHRAAHRDGSGPVHAVRFENWLVYSYWSTKAKRFEIVSVTLYEKTTIGRRQLNPWSAVPKVLDANVSGFEPTDLTVLQRTFLLPGSEITALGVTTTLRGIAAKNLLISLGGTGQILMLDQRLIDPRRTTQAPTEEEKLEGLFQYFPDLPINPTHVLSYYRGAGERGADVFYVAPSMLESTCTVVAVGLDIFKGRASPSGTFDLLAEDFNYALLVLLIISLGACVVVLRSMEKRKSLENAWL